MRYNQGRLGYFYKVSADGHKKLFRLVWVILVFQSEVKDKWMGMVLKLDCVSNC